MINDLAGKRTIDPATGVYLTRAGGSLSEAIYSFRVVDGESSITIDPVRDLRESAPKTFVIHYDLATPPLIAGPARRRGYAAIIRALLEAFADYYGDWGGSRGTFTTFVGMSDAFRDALAAWERTADAEPTGTRR